ncbi:MAG: glycosyltransferase family 2 protein [Phycisphaerae bacterium]|nr:glycosyltransferase family 2 protein [Phycisphaerae bacterium]
MLRRVSATGPRKLSIVIPVYNERATLAELIRRVAAVPLPLDKELILVDDFSTDGTRELYEGIVAEHRNVAIQVFRHERNQGKGAALRTGFSRATGDVVLVQDADLEYDPRDYPKLLRPILDGKADVVYGSRFVGGDDHRVLFFWHMIGNRVLTLLSNAFTNLNLTDMETCYKVFRAEVLREISIKSNRFDFEPEITAKISRRNKAGRHWRIYEVGISYAGRTYEEGKKITGWDGIAALMAIVRFKFFS